MAGLESLLDEYPEFRIDEMESPEDADGTNVRITARSDPNRLAAFVDDAFQAVYGRDEGYRLWVTQV
jgi:ATP-dependent Clp protease adapter protein ClpS